MELRCLTHSTTKFPGESWLWTGHGGFRAAVDVGKTTSNFGVAVAKHKPHILVLTHDDSDHIGGVGAFLEEMTVRLCSPQPPCEARHRTPTVLQIWIPYDWIRLVLVLAVTQGLLDPQEGDEVEGTGYGNWSDDIDYALGQAHADTEKVGGLTVEQVTRNRGTFGSHGHDRDLWRQWSQKGYCIENHEVSCSWPSRDDDLSNVMICEKEHCQHLMTHEMARLRGLIDKVKWSDGIDSESLIAAVADAAEKYRDEFSDLKWTGSPKEIGKRAVETAEKTLRILREGLKKKAILRFFDPDAALAYAHCCPPAPPPWRTQGEPGRVTILNAREVRVHVPVISGAPDRALALAALLTVQNSRALATYLWPGLNRRDGAIIWSDTEHRIIGRRPTGRVVPWFATSVMSAPHHASADAAHEDLWKFRPHHVHVLLSHNSHRDTLRFLSLPTAQRGCTQCAAWSPMPSVKFVTCERCCLTITEGDCLVSHT